MEKLDKYMQKNESRPPAYMTHKNKLKLIKDLNVRCKTIKILEEHIASKILDISCRNIFTDMSHCYLNRNCKGNKWKKLDYTKLKLSVQQKKPLTKWTGNPLDGKTCSPTIHLIKG